MVSRRARLDFGRRLARFGAGLAKLAIIAAALYYLPDAPGDSILRYKNAVVALFFVIGLGKLLFDTFFFQRIP